MRRCRGGGENLGAAVRGGRRSEPFVRAARMRHHQMLYNINLPTLFCRRLNAPWRSVALKGALAASWRGAIAGGIAQQASAYRWRRRGATL